MRGKPQAQPDFLTVVNLNACVPAGHPLRAIKRRVDAVLQKLSPLFDQLYAEEGRPSIPPEQLLKARVLTALYSVRSEQLFCEQLGYNLLCLWFLDREFSEGSFDHSIFAKNYERVLSAEVAKPYFPPAAKTGPSNAGPHWDLESLTELTAATFGIGCARSLLHEPIECAFPPDGKPESPKERDDRITNALKARDLKVQAEGFDRLRNFLFSVGVKVPGLSYKGLRVPRRGERNIFRRGKRRRPKRESMLFAPCLKVQKTAPSTAAMLPSSRVTCWANAPAEFSLSRRSEKNSNPKKTC